MEKVLSVLNVFSRIKAFGVWQILIDRSSFAVINTKFKIMEQQITDLNRVEIRGRVGQEPKIFNVGDAKVARFSVATNETYHDRKGDIREETTWHNVSVWQGKSIEDLSVIKKGAFVNVVGRLRNVKYTSIEGEDRHYIEIVASRINLVPAA